MALYIGLMSGTSLDGVDAVLADLGDGGPRVLAHQHQAFAAPLRAELLALNQAGQTNELHRAALAANGVARAYAAVVQALQPAVQAQGQPVRAIGAHGQTVRHRPGEFDGTGYTVQLLNGSLLAELSGIDVVCDLRSRDLAAGGQGAPLVPVFHAARFAQPGQAVAVLNVGGIANLSLLAADGGVSGFDCGPGNVLMDGWIQQHLGQAYDDQGRWAASAAPDAGLLQRCLADDFFAKAPPKSTGRDLFDAGWLAAALAARPGLAPEVVQSTLLELTVGAAAQALRAHAPQSSRLWVCGGGAHNAELMRRLAQQLPQVQVQASDAGGVAPDQVEPLAFAWLAQAFVERRPASLPAVTGARGERLLGALYPA